MTGQKLLVMNNQCKYDMYEGSFYPLFCKDSNSILGSSIVLKGEDRKYKVWEIPNLEDDQMQFNREELTCSHFEKKDIGYLIQVQLSAKIKDRIKEFSN